MGRSLDQRRFRANIYVDHLPAWSELGLVGKEIDIGGASFRVARRTRRCPATNVNPETAERDADVPKALSSHFGHADLGVYLEVLTDTTLSVSDAVGFPA